MTKSQREYVERRFAGVQQDRACSIDVDVDALLADLESDQEAVRLRALRRACPCHVSWEVFGRVRKAAQRLRRDPSERVRAAALHLERDAQEVLAMEGAVDRYWERDDDVDARRRRDRAGRRYRR